jgi:predicted dehydrogenase
MTLRVGLIGYGFAGRTFHAALISATPGLSLTAVASTRPEIVRQDHPQAEVISVQALIAQDDLDLVVIASPNESHLSLARAALQAGKNVVVDKPFTIRLSEAVELTRLSHSQGKVRSVFHNRRWESDFLAVRQAIDSGLIGRVVHFESHFDRFRPEVRDRWREQARPGSGVWFDLGPHLVDQALLIFGMPTRIQASLARLRPGAQSDDWAHLVMHYERCRVILHASMLVAGESPRFLVHGERGSLIKRRPDQQEAQLLAGQRPGSPGWGLDPDPLEHWTGDGQMSLLPLVAGDQSRYYAQLRDCLCGRANNPVTPEQACQVMEVLETGLAHGDL